jgi:histone H3/H4
MLEYNDEEYKQDEDTENSAEELSEEVNTETTEEGEEVSSEEDSEEFDEDGQPIEDEGLPFAKAEVVRLMKRNLDKDKMIRERVKVEMNKFLGEVLERVCEQLNDYPYTTIEYEMLKESIYPYTNIKRINEEKFRILKHLEAIKADCDALTMDVKKSLKLKDVDDDSDEIF